MYMYMYSWTLECLRPSDSPLSNGQDKVEGADQVEQTQPNDGGGRDADGNQRYGRTTESERWEKEERRMGGDEERETIVDALEEDQWQSTWYAPLIH